jgi:hypothetical protein
MWLFVPHPGATEHNWLFLRPAAGTFREFGSRNKAQFSALSSSDLSEQQSYTLLPAYTSPSSAMQA